MKYFFLNFFVKLACIFALALMASALIFFGYFWWFFLPLVVAFVLSDTAPMIIFGLKQAGRLKSNLDEVFEAYYGYQMLRSYPEGVDASEFRRLVDGHRIARKVSGGIIDYWRFR